MISQYWVGQIPMNNLQINVLRADGYPADCTNYTVFTPRMLDTDNQEVDLKGGHLDTTGASAGFFVFEWPRSRSLFTKTGEYVFQLVMETSREVFVYDSEKMINYDPAPEPIKGFGFTGGGSGGIVPPPGHYETALTKDITTEHVIRVRELGGRK